MLFEKNGECGVVRVRVATIEALGPHYAECDAQRAVHASAVDAESDVVRRAKPSVVAT